MKFYFAGSIRGGRDDRKLYEEIIRLLKNYGIVLSEHIAYDVSLNELNGGKTDYEIYHQDIEWINECDCVIAEVTHPSLGVGYELAYAEAHQKKVICLHRPLSHLSAMISGNLYFSVYSYNEVGELHSLFTTLFAHE